MSFLRYFDGATPKRKPPNEKGDGEQKKNYEKSRKRKFQQSWTVNRPWLNFEGGVLTCTTCKKFASSEDNAFVKGTNYLRIDGIKAILVENKIRSQCCIISFLLQML